MASGNIVTRENPEPKKLKLYSYWLSSCSYRIRICLHLKGLEYEFIAVNLSKKEHQTPEFLELNPASYVPVLVDGDIVLADSLAILMYLEEKFPQHPLLPKDLHRRAVNFQVASIVCSSIQPYQNVVLSKKMSPDKGVSWVIDHIQRCFTALEKLLKDYSGKYATGDEVFLADLFLAPQIHAAINRFKVDMNEFPLLLRVFKAYSELPAFRDTTPEKQPDTPAEHKAREC